MIQTNIITIPLRSQVSTEKLRFMMLGAVKAFMAY